MTENIVDHWALSKDAVSVVYKNYTISLVHHNNWHFEFERSKHLRRRRWGKIIYGRITGLF